MFYYIFLAVFCFVFKGFRLVFCLRFSILAFSLNFNRFVTIFIVHYAQMSEKYFVIVFLLFRFFLILSFSCYDTSYIALISSFSFRFLAFLFQFQAIDFSFLA